MRITINDYDWDDDGRDDYDPDDHERQKRVLEEPMQKTKFDTTGLDSGSLKTNTGVRRADWKDEIDIAGLKSRGSKAKSGTWRELKKRRVKTSTRIGMKRVGEKNKIDMEH